MRRLLPWLLVFCTLVYVLMAAGPWARRVWDVKHGRDFASYYYAVQAAAEGDDPYAIRSLNLRARDEGTRRAVNPFFYPPPFLLLFVWVRPLTLEAAFRAFYVADHFFLLIIALSLWRWIARPVPSVPSEAPPSITSTARVGPIVAAALAIFAVTFTPIPDNDWMGQVNLLVLAVTVLGLSLAQRQREWTGGFLLGAACMFKMSPALLVAWWLLHGRWRPVMAACLAALMLSLLSLPLVGLEYQLGFFREVLPGFGSGHYHGLTVPIDLPANHSIPSVFHQILPGRPTALGPTARHLSQITSVILLGLLGWRFRTRPIDTLTALLQVGAVVVLMLVLPVYAYEHHMVWLLIPWTALVAAMAEGRLGRRWWVLLGIAYLFQALPLDWLNSLYPRLVALGSARNPVYYALREAKFVACLLAGLACVIAAHRRGPS